MIRSLLQVGMTVPELEVGRAFYELFGLEAQVSGDDLVFRCEGSAQELLRLMPGARKKLSYVSLGTNAAGMASLVANLERHGVAIAESPFGPMAGIWFRDPHGDWLNVQVAEPLPSNAQVPAEINAPGRYRRIGTRACDPSSQQKRARPRRMGHLIKFSPDVNRSVAFYTEVLGMKVSDRAGDVLAFLRGSAGGDHHIVAFAQSTHTGLHHLSFEVADIDEIEVGAQTLLRAGYKDGFGLGRHVGGSNYFHYIRDPWNSLVEYFWDIDVIPEDDSGWEAMNVTPQELTAVWATTPPPPEFPMNFEERD
ncbi:VOC family protein [Variovorax fucosicus]|uniref:VOC family protein n=1 Tax=Variovorax fucosicus TaxID=3053517 RepID=UPI0025768993|nr:VOC family protein [Variovorax sp. J22G47]MDM0059361.1 VOC family protein [Variovorax sp. J22G47]